MNHTNASYKFYTRHLVADCSHRKPESSSHTMIHWLCVLSGCTGQTGRQAGWAQTGCAASRGCWRPQRHPHEHPVATSRLRNRKLHYARPGLLSLANTWDFYENSVSSDEHFESPRNKQTQVAYIQAGISSVLRKTSNT